MNTRQDLHLPTSGLVIFVLVLLAAFGLAALIPLAGSLINAYLFPPPIQADPLEVVNAFHSAINSNDVNALLDLFANDAVVIDNGSVIDGREQIQDWALNSQLIAGLRLTMLHTEMNGTKMIWLDTAHNGSEGQSRYYILRWEARIEDGEIQSLAILPRYMPDGK